MSIYDSKEQQNDDAACDEEIFWYLQDLAAIPELSCKAEQKNVQQIAAEPHSALADAARTRLIEANLRLVVHLARSHQSGSLALADLIQEGNLALTQAVQQIHPHDNQRFRPYIIARVQRALDRVVKKQLCQDHLNAKW